MLASLPQDTGSLRDSLCVEEVQVRNGEEVLVMVRYERRPGSKRYFRAEGSERVVTASPQNVSEGEGVVGDGVC